MTSTEKLLNAAAAGALHAQFTNVRKDPVAWLNSDALEAVADNEGVDVTDRAEWDAYCAGLYLALLPAKLRGEIVTVVNAAER